MTDRTLDMIRRYQANAVELRREAVRLRKEAAHKLVAADQCELAADVNDKAAIALRAEA